MQNNKNKPGNKPGCQNIDWEVGITALGDIYIKFTSADQHFKCTMDELTAKGIGESLLDTIEKKLCGWKPTEVKPQ